MHKDEMILISVDDHIVEPPDMFKNHLPKKYIDDAPQLVHNPDGSDTWQFRDIVIPNVAMALPAATGFRRSSGINRSAAWTASSHSPAGNGVTRTGVLRSGSVGASPL